MTLQLSGTILTELTDLRRKLHRSAEVSGNEQNTAVIIRSFLEQFSPDEVIKDLGGYGVAALYRGEKDGPVTLIRCELDALPIPETLVVEHKSGDPGSSHKCGHDGHMAIVSGLCPVLNKNRPEKGTVVLLFQPAEETGKGARLVLDDIKFAEIKPDYVFALHNLPGFPSGKIILKSGPFASASRGMVIKLKGVTSHAAEPAKGNSPALAMARLIDGLTAMPANFKDQDELVLATVIHARLGEVAFGTTPGEGVVMATLRTHSSETIGLLAKACIDLAEKTSSNYGLKCSISWTEEFPATVNDDGCVKVVEDIAVSEGVSTIWLDKPFGWSEDFGHFTDCARGAMFGLGSGENQPALHHPAYDFPDEVIENGVKVFAGIIRHYNGHIS